MQHATLGMRRWMAAITACTEVPVGASAFALVRQRSSHSLTRRYLTGEPTEHRRSACERVDAPTTPLVRMPHRCRIAVALLRIVCCIARCTLHGFALPASAALRRYSTVNRSTSLCVRRYTFTACSTP
jgi:hypothetical protein